MTRKSNGCELLNASNVRKHILECAHNRGWDATRVSPEVLRIINAKLAVAIKDTVSTLASRGVTVSEWS